MDRVAKSNLYSVYSQLSDVEALALSDGRMTSKALSLVTRAIKHQS